MFRSVLYPTFSTLCIALLSGCIGTSQGPETVEVTGKVTMEGSPVEGANVVFHPVDGGERALASQAVTDAQGRFRLATHMGGGKFKPGIVPGQYDVAINKLDTAAISSTFAPPKNLLPKEYASPKTSGLTANVAPGQDNDFEFSLTDE